MRSRWSSRIPVGLATALRLLLCAVPLAFGAAGCGHQAVKAHQREFLADRIMSLDGNPQEAAADQHILSNREGAIGGTGTSGGGCGCN